MNDVTFDEWRADLIAEDGTVIAEDVLFIRANLGDISYHCPVFTEDFDWGIQDVKDILERSCRRHDS